MLSRVFLSAMCVIAFLQGGWAAAFSVKTDTGVVLLWQSKTGYWAAIKDSAAVGPTDSLYIDDKYNATVKLDKGISLLVRGESRLCLKGSDTAVTVHLDRGQIFLKRDESSSSSQLKSVKIAVQGCTVTPVGTAAAVKLTKAGEPSVAVVRGKMRMESPKGEAVDVEPGDFSTYTPATGAFKQGKIPPDALAALEKWSGVAVEQPSTVSAGAATGSIDSSKAQKDLEKTAPAPVSAAAISAPAVSSSPAPEAPEKKTVQEQPSGAPDASAAQPASQPAGPEKDKAPASEDKFGEAPGREKGASRGISWEFSAYNVTVDKAQWTRLAFSPDIPIWKFGIGLDIECFLDEKGNFSQKGWEFDNDSWLMSVTRKIKYLRFGYEDDPFFAKVGGLSNVTLGYGFIVDDFTNLLHYPDEKLLGVQVYLNNIGPIGLTLQTMTPDIAEFKDDGGIFAGRLAVCPLKTMNLPLLSALFVGATYAMDVNQYAPARSWKYTGNIWDKNNNGKVDWDYANQRARNAADSAMVRWDTLNGIVDGNITYPKIDTVFRDSTKRYALLGGDIGMPIIKSAMLGLDIYGQAGIVADTNMFSGKRTGWGFGAPGARLTVGPLTAQAEYRHVHGKFTPGYFGPYYFDERLQRYPNPVVRSQTIDSVDLDGIFGKLGMNFCNLITISGSYQYMAGADDCLDQRFEARGNIGDALLKRIPKITKLEAFFYKTNINRTIVVYTSQGVSYPPNKKPIYDDFLEQTPSLYWGYRVGFEITKGASLIWETRYGYEWDWTGNIPRLSPNNNIIIGTAFTF
jgi:hypothetical protein